MILPPPLDGALRGALGAGGGALRHLLLLALLLGPLELCFPARPQPGPLARPRAADLLHLLVNGLLLRTAGALSLAALGGLLALALPRPAREAVAALPLPPRLAAALLLGELGAYLAHRAAHRSPLLYRLHAVHHSSPALDWLAAHRQHPLDALWHLVAANLPALLLGVSFSGVLGLLLFQKVYTAFLHSNLRWGLGPLGWVLASPRFHHRHHGADGAPRNFASLLPVLDRLFGTYAAAAELPARYGAGQEVSPGYLGQLAHPFRRAGGGGRPRGASWLAPPPNT